MRLDDGFSSQISFASNTSIKLYEKEVQPPGMSGGGAIETSTMRNTSLRTKSPKKLKDFTNSNLSCAYDPAALPDLMAMINVNQEITITLPDNTTITFWGWLDEANQQPLVEGEQPTIDIVIIPSNTDDTGEEAAPAFGTV